MNSGPASRTQSSVERHSLSRLRDELLQIIPKYFAELYYDGIRVRLVCRRFNAIVSSILLSSVLIYSPITLNSKEESDYIYLNRTWRPAALHRITAPLCPIDSHIKHVTLKLSNSAWYKSREISVYDRLPERIIRYMPALRSIKLIHNLHEIAQKIDNSQLEEAQAAVNKMITALKRIPADIHTEVELVVVPTDLDERSESLQPADWQSWQDDFQFQSLPDVIWTKNIEKVWSMIDSLDVGVGWIPENSVIDRRGALIRECSSTHILHLHGKMVPGKFLSLQFPRGFPLHLKKLHLRNPLIVNCAEVLHILRNCQHLKNPCLSFSRSRHMMVFLLDWKRWSYLKAAVHYCPLLILD